MTDSGRGSGARTLLLTLVALGAFAGNSLLNRAALAGGGIDWASFTAIRIGSGAVFLWLLIMVRRGGVDGLGLRGIEMPLSLFGYAALFSWAYRSLSAATGALILFALVQLTMQTIGIARGQHPAPRQWIGLALAFAGLVWLLLPGLAAPPLFPALAMAGAGVAWGIYSWLGRGASDPVLTTARNFFWAAPMAGVLLAVALATTTPVLSAKGVLLAVASGAITSGLGYVIWYAVLPRLSVTTAAVGQLSVPAIAALGGVLLLGEDMSARLLGATVIILLGIGLTIRQPRTRDR